MGPNGSGKSNVIDAMLFVFGKKAKKVRAGLLPPTLGGGHSALLSTGLCVELAEQCSVQPMHPACLPAGLLASLPATSAHMRFSRGP